MQQSATLIEPNQPSPAVAFHCVQQIPALTIMSDASPKASSTCEKGEATDNQTPQATTHTVSQTSPSSASPLRQAGKQGVDVASMKTLGNTAPRLMERMKPLATSFTPGPFDVICGIGKEARNHIGNLNFRKRIKKSVEDYSNATNRSHKSKIVMAIVNEIRKGSPFGGFIKHQGGRWHEVGDSIAREKVGQYLRDSLSNRYRSSSKSKRQKRLESLGKMEENLVEILSRNHDIKESMEDLSSKAKTGSEKDFTNSNTKILEAIKKDEPLQSEGHDVIKKAGL